MSLKLYDRIHIAEGEVYPYAVWLPLVLCRMVMLAQSAVKPKKP